MKLLLIRILAVLLMLAACQSSRAAPEPWTDQGLQVKDGLELWFDASRQNAARLAKQLPGLNDGRPVDIWFDGSGNQIDLVQRIPELRPHFKMASGGAFVRFDGKDDSFAAANLRRAFTNMTIFVVAAPRSNSGNFRALLGLNATGRNDYQSGLNLDLGPSASATFSVLNAEGGGFHGVRNLLTNASAFRTFHTIALACEPGSGGVRLFVDGTAHGTRERNAPSLRMDEVTIGARCFSNTPEPPHTQGFFDGDIAEVIIFNRTLLANERTAVERYLNEKYANLRSASEELVPGGLRPLEVVANPPAVQMFVPGFTVRELPIALKNINNVKYRPDGKLVALGYNGRIYLLSDTDGDGREDRVQPFWERDALRAPIGMALTPAGYERGEGLFVAAKGKLALIVDHDHDGRADEEVIVASGWKELGHGVDALGVALDREGNIYFGLGCANFTDPYLIDKASGKSQYDLRNERGTILKVSPDFQHREIVCTGIRFPVSLAFNQNGDLFCTDQEGATWLPNGNPFDELLHIQPGRHYGFPPRHPKYLPNVINEPSVFDYAPQHQSTCGLNFNESVNGGPVFGPSWWTGDAIVSGYSRGKLFRTKVVKTRRGYVAQNHLIAALNMLAVDACVSPQGDLVVAAHSGNPDWGSGPDGQGKLYKISYTGKELAQPVIAWAASPTEMRIAFDRPLDPTQLRELTKRTTITQGRYLSAGDRFESLRPGYQAVQDQLGAPRHDVPVVSVMLEADLRTLILNTPPQNAAINYAISFPRFGVADDDRKKRELPQQAVIDLALDLTGVEAVWRGGSGALAWTGWLPHPDFQASRAFTGASAEHQRLWPLLNKPGKLTLRGQLDLWQMLEPAVQPGSQIDYTPAPEQVIIEFAALAPFKLKTSSSGFGAPAKLQKVSVQPQRDHCVPIEISLETGKVEPNLQVTWHTADDPRPRALPLRRILLPWAIPQTENQTNKLDRQIPEIAGGNWLHGKRLFFNDQVACSKCHSIQGEGSKIGPDLSNLVFRDYTTVLRDIISPNATINPDHLAYNIQLRNGDSLAGVLQSDKTNEIVLGVVSGESVRVPKNQIASISPSTISLMPEGLTQALSTQQLKDLMTFLLISPLDPAPLEAAGEPPARTLAQLDKLVRPLSTIQQGTNIFRILLSAGPKDHGPGEHDYPLWQTRWEKLLGLADGIKVSTTFGWPKPEQFQNADVIVFYSDNPGWSSQTAPELDQFLKRGGGLVYLHYAVDGHQAVTELSERIGLAWHGGASKFRHGPLDLQFTSHPLAAGFERLNLIDESYWQLVGDQKNVDLVATGAEESVARPLVWTREQGKGRVFVSIPGHYTWTFDDPLFRVLILRGICWAGHQPVDRLAELATVGARVSE